jgi:hypothetical protein
MTRQKSILIAAQHATVLPKQVLEEIFVVDM